jgi:pimeloyl-ACP methyl ester carboxylesterase
LTLLQDKLIYMPRHYTRDGGASQQEHIYYQQLLYHPFVIPFTYSTTYSGIQTAFLVNKFNDKNTPRPSYDNHTDVKHINRIWMLTGGNAMTALDWLPTLIRYHTNEHQYTHTSSTSESHEIIENTFLLIDYPGYGLNSNQYKASPSTILDNCRSALSSVLHLYTQKYQDNDSTHKNSIDSNHYRDTISSNTVNKISSHVNVNENQNVEICLCGHSLGSAAALQLAHDIVTNEQSNNKAMISIHKLLLISPFTSISDMARELLHIKLPFMNVLLRHEYDNRAKLTHLLQHLKSSSSATASLSIDIIHGTQDEIVPVKMGRELASLDSKRIHYQELPYASHNDILETAQRQIFSIWSR